MICWKVCSWKCFSLGVHIDFQHRYIDLHIWNWFIHTGDLAHSEIQDQLAVDEMYELQRRMGDMTDKHIKAYNKDYHPILV